MRKLNYISTKTSPTLIESSSWRLVGATGHTVPTATSFPQPLLSQIPTSSRTVSPASPHPAPATSSTWLTSEAVNIWNRGKSLGSTESDAHTHTHVRAYTHAPSWNESPLGDVSLSRFSFSDRNAPLPQGRADTADKNCLAQCYI